MPSSDSNQGILKSKDQKASAGSRLAMFGALANPIVGIGKNLFETSKAVFDAVLGKLTYGLETLSDSLTKLSGHSNNMGIASAALNGIETVLLSPLSLYLRYKAKQANQESFSWHTKAKFVYGLVVFAATIFAMAFPPAAIVINIVLAASGIIASGISLARNIKRRMASGDTNNLQNLEGGLSAEGEQNGNGLKNDKTNKVPDNSKIAHKVFGVLLAVAGMVAVGLAASGGGLLVAAGIVGAVVAVLGTVQLFTKIAEVIYKARAGSAPNEIEPVHNPESRLEHVNQVTSEQEVPVVSDVSKTTPVQTQKRNAHQESQKQVLANEQQLPANEVKPALTPDKMKEAIRELKQGGSSMGTGLSGWGRVRF